MAHEELKAQYEEDAKNYDKPWELWQFRLGDKYEWKEIMREPGFHSDVEYRRKEPITNINMKPWEIMKAHEEGAEIEMKLRSETKWSPSPRPTWSWHEVEYRIKDKTDWSKVTPGTHVIINEEGKPAQKGIFLNSYVRASTKSGKFFNNIELSCTGILVWPCGSYETYVCLYEEVSLDPDAPKFK